MKYLFILMIMVVPALSFGNHFKTIDISNGLSNNTVKCIAQDKNGFMWFGTYDGLCRYDGVNFTIFRNDKNDPFSISHNFITSILAVDKGLWIGTESGLNFLSFEDYKFYHCRIRVQKNEDILILGSIRNIVQIDSLVFVLSASEGLLSESGKNTFEAYEVNHLNSALINIAPYKNNSFLAHSAEGMYVIDANGHSIKNQINYEANQSIDQLYYSKNRDLIFVGSGLGHNSKVFTEKGDKFEMLNYSKPLAGVKSITDYNSDIVFGTDGNGLMISSVASDNYYTPQNSDISSDAIYSLFVDAENNLWIGTLRGGISIYSERNQWFSTLSLTNNQLKHNFVTSVYESADKNLFIGTDGGGLNIFNQLTGKISSYTTNNSKISGNNVLSVVGDGKYLWLGIYGGGVNRFDPINKTFKKFSLPVEADNLNRDLVWVVKDDHKGNLWIGSISGLFCMNKKSDKFTVIQASIRNVSEIAFSKTRIWVSTNGDGLFELDLEGNIVKHYLNDGKEGSIPNNIVRYVFVDSDDQIWFGTEHTGLNQLNKANGTYKTYGIANGFSNPNVVGITQDQAKNLWISSYNGLFRFNPAKETFLRFGTEDNLPSTQFNYNACYNNKGVMYFGTSKGLVRFSSDQINFNATSQKVIFTGLELMKNDIQKADEQRICPPNIKLSYNENFFTISFSKPELLSPDKIKFSFYLDNFEKPGQHIDTKRQASYTNVPPGEYIFYVTSTNCEGEWDKTYSSVKIRITPPWWKTNLATTIFVMLVIFLLYLIFWFFRHELKMKHMVELKEIEKDKIKTINEAKLNFFTNISHEFRTPIFLLTAPLEELMASKSKFIQVSRTHLLSMHRNALRLNKLISRIIDFRKLEEGKLKLELQKENIVGFCKGLVPDYEALCEQKGILLLFMPSKIDIPLTFDPEKMESIISNLISNAFKCTPENGKIIFAIREEHDSVVFTIEDNGIGIKKEYFDAIFDKFFQVDINNSSTVGDGIGLAFVKHLVELHGGNISVKSELNKGSIFTISIPNHLSDDCVEILHSKSAVTPDGANQEPNTKLVNSHSNPVALNCILVIDDEIEIVDLIERYLIEDFKVLKAGNGIEALVKTRESMPDLIICDVMMPKMNGIEFVSALKKDKLLAHIPVIMLTAKTSEEDMLKAFECGADAYLTKPVSIKFLTKRINHLLTNAESIDIGQFITGQKKNYTKEEKKFMLKCKKVIDDNLLNPDFDISLFSEALGMSHSSLYKKIKVMTDKSLIEFVNAYRIYKAIQFFNEGITNINSVCAKCGFNDSKNFREGFKRKMGVTPSQYLQKM